MPRTRVLIMGAAGRDFHNFNTVYRDNDAFEVVAFTATQIPNIEGRQYPAELAGRLYPGGIRIYPESELLDLIRDLKVDEVVFAYSDVPHAYVMHQASRVLAAGANFKLLGPKDTQLASTRPVVSVGAVRTGAGKSQTTRRVADILRGLGYTVAAVRHPMPYGNLIKQTAQRFADYDDLDEYECTIEEREEYEPHLDRGVLVFAGVDYEKILRLAEQEADIILWDGGNNDLPFYRPDLHVVVADPHRPGHELRYYPGETNLRLADVVVINKVDTADPSGIATVEANVRAVNRKAVVIRANSPVTVRDPDLVRGKRVLVIEDGPTLTHGEMRYGAGLVAAHRLHAAEIVDPRPYAQGSIREVFAKYTHVTQVLPAMGYGDRQIAELSATIERVPCDAVLIATPIDLGHLMRIPKPSTRVLYDLEEHDRLALPKAIAECITRRAGAPGREVPSHA